MINKEREKLICKKAVERVLLKVWEKIRKNKKMLQIMDTQKKVLEQRNTILDALMSKIIRGKEEDASHIYQHFHEMFQSEYEEMGLVAFLLLLSLLPGYIM